MTRFYQISQVDIQDVAKLVVEVSKVKELSSSG